MVRNIWGDPERFKEQYWTRVPGSYFTGDAARRDDDGYFWVLGRVDDVMNVSGHRLSTMEIESALVHHPAVAEAAVVGKPHEITGQAVCAFRHAEEGRLEPRRARRGAAPVGGARDRHLRAAGGDPLHRCAAQDAQRQNHAAAAARDRDVECGHRRRDDAGRSVRRDQSCPRSRTKSSDFASILTATENPLPKSAFLSASPRALEAAPAARSDWSPAEAYWARPVGRDVAGFGCVTGGITNSRCAPIPNILWKIFRDGPSG